MKTLKKGPQKLLIIGPKLFFHKYGPAAQTSQEVIFHILNMSQNSSASLNVLWLCWQKNFPLGSFILSSSLTFFSWFREQTDSFLQCFCCTDFLTCLRENYPPCSTYIHNNGNLIKIFNIVHTYLLNHCTTVKK